jgi:dihydrofolate reductase
MSPEQEQWKLREALESGSHLLGRVTYEGFAAAWPQREGEFADHINSMPKYVVSSTLSEPLEWENSTLISGDVADQVGKLKERDEAPILVAGSATLVHSLIENDLVDELRLMVFPVVLGGGKRPFPENGQKKSFRLAGTETFESGVAVNTYEPA